MKLTSFLSNDEQGDAQIERNLLKNQSASLLRRYIINGRIPPGTKLTERELADLLGVSRMPARDALMDLEREGLVISKPNGRYVIEVGPEEIDQLFAVRLVLEKLAVREAAIKSTPEHCARLHKALDRMGEAIASDDWVGYLESDLEAHRLIWEQADNPYLLKSLNSIIGPIFMFMAHQTEVKDSWIQTYQLHKDLVELICNQEVELASESMDRHIGLSLDLSHKVFDP